MQEAAEMELVTQRKNVQTKAEPRMDLVQVVMEFAAPLLPVVEPSFLKIIHILSQKVKKIHIAPFKFARAKII